MQVKSSVTTPCYSCNTTLRGTNRCQNLGYDTISFGSKQKSNTSDDVVRTDYMKKTTALGTDIYKALSKGAGKEGITALLSEQYPGIEIVDNDSLDKYTQAVFHNGSTFGEKTEPKFEFDFSKIEKDPGQIDTFAECIAHESTHAEQLIYQKQDKKLLSKMSEDEGYQFAVSSFGGTLFKIFCENPDFVKEFCMSPMSYKPGLKHFLAKHPLAKSKESATRFVNSNYDTVFDNLALIISKKSTKLNEEQTSALTEAAKKKEFKSDVRKYIAFRCKAEKEAYTASQDTLRAIYGKSGAIYPEIENMVRLHSFYEQVFSN